MGYGDWLKEQTPERQITSAEHMGRCRRYGEAQRTAPTSEETEKLRREIAAYYDRWS